MTKFIIEATDRLTGRTVYATLRHGVICFAQQGRYIVNRQQGQENPYAHYERSVAEEFDGSMAIVLMTQLAEDPHMAPRWAVFPRIVLAQDNSVMITPERTEP